MQYLRLAQPGDAASLCRIDEITRGASVSPVLYAAHCSAGGNQMALVWDDWGQIGGFLACTWVLDEATIQHVAVKPSQQHRGIGRALLGAGLDLLRQRGIRRCLLEVRASNVIAQRLYYRAGFEVDGRRPAYYPGSGGREDALLMSVSL